MSLARARIDGNTGFLILVSIYVREFPAHRLRVPGREVAYGWVGDVAAYILRKNGPMTAMKLQKLCYYSYAWEGRKLFPEPFQAWANGPVCRALYNQHRGRLNLEAGDIEGTPKTLDNGERESVDLVLEAYGDLSAHQLSVMTHDEAPWIKARKRSKAGPMERSTARLRDEDILDFFDALTSRHGSEA